MSADLQRRLEALGGELDWPETPDLAGAVVRQITITQDTRPVARRRTGLRRRRRVALAVALALLVPVTAAFAFPDARDNVLDWVGLRSVQVERVPTVPAGAQRPALAALGPAMSLRDAARRARFTPQLPSALGPPESVRVRDGVVSLVYRDGRLVVTELRGALDRQLLRKVVSVDNAVRRVRGGIFITGPQHAYFYVRPDGTVAQARPRLAGNTLVVEHGDLLVRVEGGEGLTAARAQAIAASLVNAR